MAVLYVGSPVLPDSWCDALRQALSGAEVRVWPEIGNRAEVEAAVVFERTPGALCGLPNLKLVSAMGLGVEHLVLDPDIPADVQIVRAVDAVILEQMSDYILLHVLMAQYRSVAFDNARNSRSWMRHLAFDSVVKRQVGFLGFGALGAHASAALIERQFPVRAWSRTRHSVSGIQSFAGDLELNDFLAGSEILVCALPLTDSTRGILNDNSLRKLPAGASLINVGRGAHIVDDDLLAALDSGQLANAFLDVFNTEPLPPNHAFWTHPLIRITPHCAAVPDPRRTMLRIADNIRRLSIGEPLLDVVDRLQGY